MKTPYREQVHRADDLSSTGMYYLEIQKECPPRGQHYQEREEREKDGRVRQGIPRLFEEVEEPVENPVCAS